MDAGYSENDRDGNDYRRAPFLVINPLPVSLAQRVAVGFAQAKGCCLQESGPHSGRLRYTRTHAVPTGTAAGMGETRSKHQEWKMIHLLYRYAYRTNTGDRRVLTEQELTSAGVHCDADSREQKAEVRRPGWDRSRVGHRPVEAERLTTRPSEPSSKAISGPRRARGRRLRSRAMPTAKMAAHAI